MESEPSFYAIIPANVRYSNIPANAKLLYGEITALCSQKGFCWAGNKYFAELYGVSNVTISRWIKSLIDKGFINSTLIYKEGTKEIEKRSIQICKGGININDMTPLRKVNDPINKNVKDINTVNNTINNNIDWNQLIIVFNKITGKRIKSVNDKAKRQIKNILKDYDKNDFLLAIKNCYEDDYHLENKHKYLTLEFISRPDKFERFYGMQPKVTKNDLGNRANDLLNREENS